MQHCPIPYSFEKVQFFHRRDSTTIIDSDIVIHDNNKCIIKNIKQKKVLLIDTTISHPLYTDTETLLVQIHSHSISRNNSLYLLCMAQFRLDNSI